ncbi:hypothetical protein AV530_004707 [Patagioenas fasciata monilis]|uniref:Transcription factor CBF/NF-Y/archaeal histone domain-containing protein n=1 Tax=Patagioenas fasciata monilis TaxID=372326 RepID=A0A1V4JZD4_PATFA|nr:hypothetical protein AV530_004707 [Patagioenas fasciata monilis]
MCRCERSVTGGFPPVEGVSCCTAEELFVETIAKDAYVYAQQGKRKTLQRKDLDNAIEAIDEFAFLEGTLD